MYGSSGSSPQRAVDQAEAVILDREPGGRLYSSDLSYVLAQFGRLVSDIRIPGLKCELDHPKIEALCSCTDFGCVCKVRHEGGQQVERMSR
jgi:hypothetical protein